MTVRFDGSWQNALARIDALASGSAAAPLHCRSVISTRELRDAAPPLPVAKSAEPPPVIDGEVIGFRQWTIRIEHDWKLAGGGVGADHAWAAGVSEATCVLGHGHASPNHDCECGLHAYTTPNAEWRSGRVPTRWRGGHRPAVPGALAAWGDEFYLHPGGFRAQYARPVLLALCDDWPRAFRAAVTALATEYDCDVCDFAMLKDAASEHGQLVPEGLAPEPPPAPEVRDAAGGVSRSALARYAYAAANLRASGLTVREAQGIFQQRF